MSFLDSVKNKAASLALRAFLNQHVSRYGVLGPITVDLKQGIITAFITPVGSSAAWHASVACRISENKLAVCAASISGTGSDWVNLLAQDHLVGKEFDIPLAVAKML